jgi:hypothetical protein
LHLPGDKEQNPVHDGFVTAADDFYEDDEPLEDVVRAFQEGEKYVTEPPHQGMTMYFAFGAPATPWQPAAGNPPASVVRC